MTELQIMERVDPLTFHYIDKIMIARVVVDNRAPTIPTGEISKKVNYILNLENKEPLVLTHTDSYDVRDALVNRLRTGDRHTNEDFIRKIDHLALTNWNKKIDKLKSENHELEELNPDEEEFGGRKSRRKRVKRCSRKYKK